MRKNILGKKKKILLVEDSRLTAKIVEDFLHKCGYEMETAVTGEEAVQKISGGSLPDLVLMDIELAGEMNGIDAARRILKSRDVPVVFLTASTSGKTIEKIKEVKVYGFVFKNTDKAALLSTVEMALKLHEANAHLQAREATLSAIMDSARDAIAVLDAEGKVVFWNPAAEQLFGYSREEVLGKDLLRLVVPNKHLYELHVQAFRRFQLTGEGNAIGKTIELKVKRKDGRELDVELSVSAFRIGDAWHAVGIVRDISERKRLEEENRRKEEQLRMMLEGIPSPAWLVSRERRILAQNKAAEIVIGTKVGNYCWRSIHGTQSLPDKYRGAIEKSGSPLSGTKCYFCRGDEALDRNEPINDEVEFAGSIWDTWWIPLDEDIYLHYATDVTKYKEMEEKLRPESVK
ncbi:MAG: PAS domain S-box protein [Desulfotomaculum sp.]|nr:PAS domain S-box protein [Desulfotomaculum sp.]